MGVKSTVYLSQKEAEDKFIQLYVDRKIAKLRAKARRKLTRLTSTEIEDKLEAWNDRANGGEGYENYLINKQL